MALTFELLILIFVRSFRQWDFRQYKAALMAITPWMSALDRTNYSRWLLVHIRDISHVQSLVSTIEELGNSFEEESTDLISLVSKDIADPAMKATLNNIKSIGKGQYELFIKERLTERSKPIDDNISRNNLPLWKPGSKSSTSKEKMRLKSVKTDCQLFSKPYIGCQS